MADALTVTSILQGMSKQAVADMAGMEMFVSTISLPTGAAETEVVLGGVSNPKVIAVFGGAGVSARLVGTTGTVLHADPILVLTNKAGFAQGSLFLSNAGSQPASVTIMAAE